MFVLNTYNNRTFFFIFRIPRIHLAMASYQLLLVVCVLVINAHVIVEGCSVIKGAKIKFTNVWWAIQASPVVLRGSYVDSDQENNTVTLSVSCIYKNGGLDLPLNITLLNAKHRTSCDGTHLDDGKVYIIGLRPATAGLADTFLINEPLPILNRVAVDGDSSDNQRRIANLCDFGNITYPQGYLDCQGQQSGCAAYTCPPRNATLATCFQPNQYHNGGSGGQSLYSISILLLLLSPLVPMFQ